MLWTESLLNPCKTELAVLREDWCPSSLEPAEPGVKEAGCSGGARWLV